ncbi:Autophagy-related protein [Halotydeus destructor]|nr:Autophagy-related protein [Halotydeus destructor]
MNARTNNYEIQCEGHQVAEVVSSLLQSIILHRSYGKFTYKHEGSYSIGTLGYEETVCDFIDFTYVRCASPRLVEKVNSVVREFVEKLRESQNQLGTISIEFFVRRQSKWNIYETPLVWEVWSISVDCNGSNKERLEDILLEKMIGIVQAINSSKSYIPQMPSEQHLDTVFDISLLDVQPYLHKLNYKIGNQGGNVMASNQIPSSALKKFIKDTLF